MATCSINNISLKIQRSDAHKFAREHAYDPELKLRLYNFIRDSARSYEPKSIEEATQFILASIDGFNEIFTRLPEYVEMENLLKLIWNEKEVTEKMQNLFEFADPNESVLNRKVITLMNNLFGTNRRLTTYVQNIFKEFAFNCMFINRSEVVKNSLGIDYGVVNKIGKLNNNIYTFLNYLYKNIYDHLKSCGIELKDNKLYESLKYLDTLDSETRDLIERHIVEKVKEGGSVNDFFKNFDFSSDFSTIDSLSRAYISWAILNNFDHFVDMFLRKSVTRVANSHGVFKSNIKYSLKYSGDLSYGFTESDDVDIAKGTDESTKLAITSLAIKTFDNGTRTGEYLTFQDWGYIISNIKSLIYNPASSENFGNERYTFSEYTKEILNKYELKNLKDIITSYIINPGEILPALFEILCNSEFKNNNVGIYENIFHKSMLNRIRTINDGFFNGETSFRELLNQTNEVDYYSLILSSASAIHNNKLLLYYKENGIVQVRTLEDMQRVRVFNNIRSNINEQTKIYSILGINRLKEKYNLEFTDIKLKPLNISDGNKAKQLASMRLTIPGTDIVINIHRNSNEITYQSLKFLENYRLFTPEVKKSIKDFIVDALKYDDLNNDILFQNFVDICSFESKAVMDLLNIAVRSIFTNIIKYGYGNYATEESISKLNATNVKYYRMFNGELDVTCTMDNNKLFNLATATLITRNLYTSSTVNDGDGNANSKQTFNRLLNSYQSQWRLIGRNSPVKHFGLLNSPKFIKEVFNSKEFFDRFEGTKQTNKMNSDELMIAGFLYDFIGSKVTEPNHYNKRMVSNGTALFLTSVNSDKNNASKIYVDLNSEFIVNGKKVVLNKCTSEELILIINYEMSTYYQNIVDNVNTDFIKLFNYFGTTFNSLNDFKNNFDNNTLGNLPPKKNGETQYDYIQRLVTTYNYNNFNNPILLVNNVHLVNRGGELFINEVLIANLERYSDPEASKEFWKEKKVELIKTVLNANLKIDLTNDQLLENQAIDRWNYNNKENWIDDSGNLILCKVHKFDKKSKSVETINIAKREDLYRVDNKKTWNDTIDTLNGDSIELNPLLEQYNLLDHLITQEFVCSTVGSHIAHPLKGRDIKQMESSQIGSANKRNSSFTTPVIPFTLNSKRGITDTYNVAVCDDLVDVQGNVNGLLTEIEGADGATFVNPFTVRLEDNSMGGIKATVIKKSFVHFFNENTGTGGHIKTACFGITNDVIRNSEHFRNMMKKMTDVTWKNENGENAVIDISDVFYDLDDIYYKQGNKFYKMLDVDSIGDNKYEITMIEVDNYGEEIGEEEIHTTNEINSNYKLWQLFGGMKSMRKSNGNSGKLVYSEDSITNVVNIMNNVEDGRVLKKSQIDYLCMSSAVKYGAANVNTSVHLENDEPLNFFRIKLINAGIVLEKEHDLSSYSEISAPTQALTSAGLNGFTLELSHAMFSILGKLSNLKTSKHLEAARELFGNEHNEEFANTFRGILNDLLIKDFQKNSNSFNNFAEKIAASLIYQAKILRLESNPQKSDLDVPMSDNTIFNKVITSINSYLTSLGIKTKLPGIQGILVPSYKRYRLYGDKLLSQYENSEVDEDRVELIYEDAEDFNIPLFNLLSELQMRINPIYIKEEGNQSISHLKLGRTYIVEYENGEKRNIDVITPIDYQRLKSQVKAGEVKTITENVEMGRELANFNIIFQDNLGNSHQLYDLDSINLLYELLEISKIKDLKAKVSAIQNLANKYSFIMLKSLMIRDLDMKSYIIASGQTTIYTADEVDKTIRTIKKLAETQKWFDLRALSKTHGSFTEGYNKLMSEKVKDNNWYLRFAYWANIVFRLGHNDKLMIDGKYQMVDASNFEKANEFVKELLNYYDNKAYIENKALAIDKNSITTEEYEVIFPKVYMELFGLDNNTYLSDIVKHPEYFTMKLMDMNSTHVDSNYYTVELKRSDGNHLYLLDQSQYKSCQTPLKKVEIYTEEINGELFRIDNNGNIMYRFNEGDTIFQDSEGTEVIVTNNMKLYIDDTEYYSIKFSNEMSNSVFNNLWGDNGVFKNTSNTIALNIYASHEGSKAKIILQLEKENQNTINNPNLQREGTKMHTSFLKVLEIISARIPGQSMQSFMGAKIVAFHGENTNSVYVPTMQNILQGSDYDIDTVTNIMRPIKPNGQLQMWSPYANLMDINLLNASEKLPYPTGKTIEELPIDSQKCYKFLEKYKDIISIRKNGLEFSIRFKNDNVENITLLSELLRDLFYDIDENDNLEIIRDLISRTYNIKIEDVNQISDIINGVKDQIDYHNTYMDRLSKNSVLNAVMNYLVTNQRDVIINSMNLTQSQMPTDFITRPFKNLANLTIIAKMLSGIGTGNVFGKFSQYVNAISGKEDVGIAAVGMKAYGLLAIYYDYILQHGTPEQIKRLLIKKGNFETLRSTNPLLANSFIDDPSSIKDLKVLDALSRMNRSSDAALDIAAIISLAADNAKDLALGNLNAGPNLLGLYLYGLSVGKTAEEISKLLTSDVGMECTRLLSSNVYNLQNGIFRAYYIRDHFIKEMNRNYLNKFKTLYAPNGKNMRTTILGRFENEFNKILDDKVNKLNFEKKILRFGSSDDTLQNKINTIYNICEKIANNFRRTADTDYNIYVAQMTCLLRDVLIDYVTKVDEYKGGKNKSMLEDIHQLAVGAEEFRLLGSLCSCNQGIKADITDFLKLISNFEECIKTMRKINSKDQGKIQHEIIDFKRFVFDKKYQKECIEDYEKVKHSFNILEAIVSSPSYNAFLEVMATALYENERSFKFRTIKNLMSEFRDSDFKNKKGISVDMLKNGNRIRKGISDYVDDQMKRTWLTLTQPMFVLPKSTEEDFFWRCTSRGKIYKNEETLEIHLGADCDNATFRLLMEHKIIPELKEKYKDNKFMLDLTRVNTNTNLTHNDISAYSLGINMMPRGIEENAVLDYYKSEFNKLQNEVYEYKYLIVGENGEIIDKVWKIPVTDLFIYYCMIAHNWKSNTRSLVPILDDIQETNSTIRNYRNFITEYDKHALPLTLEDVYVERANSKGELLYYVAPFGSSNTSDFDVIICKDHSTGRYYFNTRTTPSRNKRVENNIDYDLDYDYDQIEDEGVSSKYVKVLPNLKAIGIMKGFEERHSTTVKFNYLTTSNADLTVTCSVRHKSTSSKITSEEIEERQKSGKEYKSANVKRGDYIYEPEVSYLRIHDNTTGKDYSLNSEKLEKYKNGEYKDYLLPRKYAGGFTIEFDKIESIYELEKGNTCSI